MRTADQSAPLGDGTPRICEIVPKADRMDYMWTILGGTSEHVADCSQTAGAGLQESVGLLGDFPESRGMLLNNIRVKVLEMRNAVTECSDPFADR